MTGGREMSWDAAGISRATVRRYRDRSPWPASRSSVTTAVWRHALWWVKFDQLSLPASQQSPLWQINCHHCKIVNLVQGEYPQILPLSIGLPTSMCGVDCNFCVVYRCVCMVIHLQSTATVQRCQECSLHSVNRHIGIFAKLWLTRSHAIATVSAR